jgi:GAF domain-containing protein
LAIEQAERDLQEQTTNAQRRAEAEARRAAAEMTQCAIELESRIGDLVGHLDQVRASVAEIRERLLAQMRTFGDEPVPASESRVENAPQESTNEAEHPEAEESAPVVSADDTVRVLRAALEALNRQRNGDWRRDGETATPGS